MRLRVFTAFSGYDSQCIALRRLCANFDLVGWSEIDKNAIRAHNAVFPEYAQFNYGDISCINWRNVPAFDLFTYSFPCTDITSQGRALGFSIGTGTRSSLLWACRGAIEMHHPRYLVAENVPGLLHNKHRHALTAWMLFLHNQGYTSQFFKIDARDWGVPQARKRVFIVSEYQAKGRLQEPVNWYEYNPIPCLGWYLDDKVEVDNGTWAIISRPVSPSFKSVREHYVRGACSTLCCTCRGAHPHWVCLPDGTSRKLTGTEYLRLMGLGEGDIVKIAAACPKTALYDLAGNSIVVHVMEAIFRALLFTPRIVEPTLF